uniref:Micro-fibrillar-associated protein 1 C-terminal domain-containing protein n=1 Tax=Chenopodium quinoa TaxID=63459 RepID=A0A803N8R6_CHEQI
MSVTAGVSDTIIAIREKLRGKIGQTKVKRYWPGKAPEWADEAEEEADLRTSSRRQTLEHAFPVNEDATFTRGDDPRLRRLAENRAENKEELKLAKPVFVPKQERETIAERERVEAEEQALEEAVRRRLEERKVETKQIVVEKIREYEVIQKNLEAEADIADIDTDDEVNEAEEYESWKAKQKWRFMQKYYHKGAFFQEDPDDRAGTAGGDTIFRRDFSEPTGDDKLDKTILPKVMQVKHFGRSGRTKWTHLVNEDTTDWNNPPLREQFGIQLIPSVHGSINLHHSLGVSMYVANLGRAQCLQHPGRRAGYDNSCIQQRVDDL